MTENLPARSGELAPMTQRFPVFDPERSRELKEVLDANVGPRGLSELELERVKVPTGGSQLWLVPGLDGDEAVKDLTGIIMAWRNTRRYWRIPYAERGKKTGPPDCRSKDGFWGEGDPGGECDHCPLAQWGSDPKGGRGQACKEVKQLLLLRDGHNLPVVLNVPPTSVKNVERFIHRLADVSLPFWGAVVTLRLEKTQNPDGIDYARIVLTMQTRLSREEREVLRPFQQQMESILHPLDIDVEAEDAGGAEDYDGGPRES